jgi:hypothetical protein
MKYKTKRLLIDSLLLIAVLICITLPMASASVADFGTFKKGECVILLQTCADCTYNTITSVNYPNSTVAMGITPMTKVNTVYNATFCNTEELGEYIVNGFGDLGGTDTIWNYKFEVTDNGKTTPSGGVINLFIIFFLVCLAFTAYIILYDLGHFISLDFDIIDVAFNWGIYFVVVALYGLERFYLGSPMIETWLLWFIKIGGFVLIFMPLLAFILSITVGTLKNKRINTEVPAKWQFRRQRI